MKKSITRIAVIACSFLSTTAFAQLLTPEVLYYKFDGSGTTVPNEASAPPVGTTTANIMGGVTQGGNTLCSGSLIGSGVSSSTDYLNTGWAPNLGTGSWTIAWRSQGISTNATLYYIFGDANTASFRCFTNGIAGSTNWVIRGGGLTDTYINGGALSTSTFCAYVYDATLNQVRGYLNGVLVSTVAQTAPNFTGAGPFKVMGYSTNVGAPAGGLMDEFRVYSRALTGAELMQLNNPYVPSGFLGSDINFCNSGTAMLSLNGWPNTSVMWSNASTNDTTYVSAPGQYTVSVSGACGSGMDTIMINDLRTTSSMSASSCSGSYTAPSGAVYTMSGTYMDTIQNAALCDSIITISVSIGSSTTSSMAVTVCNSYTAPSGAVVTSSGTFNDTITNASGCDSVITIALTVNASTSSSFSASACDMYTTPSGAMVMSSGIVMDTIPNMAGCDSVMTINVTINTPTSANVSASACDMYTTPSGATYMMSGTYMDTITNMAGCDSVITINLMILNSSTASISASTCGGVYTAPSGATYSTSGTYTDIIPNMSGCDSTITITLTVTNINAGATVAGSMCTATGLTAGSTFQWLDCNGMTPVAGATSSTYNATANGSYCVVITNGSCVDTSNCVVVAVGVEENTFELGINIYPNPNSGNFTINLGNTYSDVTVVITDLAGRVVYSHMENSTNMIPVQLDAAAGAYVVIVTSGDNRATFRINKD